MPDLNESQSVAALGGIAETLLIPLAARALAPVLNPDLAFRDPIAETVFAQLVSDRARFSDDKASMRGSIVRTQWFDAVVQRFLEQHPEGLCVSLGSGLDARANRVGVDRYPEAHWLDIDDATVVGLRERYLPQAKNITCCIADLNTADWVRHLPWWEGRPALFVAEGVMMYLSPAGAEGLVRELGATADEHQAAVELAFDYASPWMVRNSRRHPSVKKTQASFHWALAKPKDLQSVDAWLKVAEQVDIAAGSGLVPAIMSKVHRLVTGRFVYGCVLYERKPQGGSQLSAV